VATTQWGVTSVFSATRKVPVFGTGPLTNQIERAMRRERQLARLTGLCGTLALFLTCMGICGTVSYGVGRRSREIGIRMTLGARSDQILGSTMRELLLVGLGTVLGLACALTRWLESQLFELSPTDPLSLILATLLLVAVAGLAVYVPARRASRLDPVEVLRFE